MDNPRAKIKHIVFDLGGVLFDWNPRYLFSKMFSDQREMEYFLTQVCSQDWNEKQDAGRPFAEGVLELKSKYPQFSEYIEAYDKRWNEMLRGPILETVEVLQKLSEQKSENGLRLFALSNWSAEKFVHVRENYDLIKIFEGIILSGEIGLIKPEPAIYQHLLERFKVESKECIFIDDNLANIEAARKLGFLGHHFKGALELKAELERHGLLLD